MVRSSGRRGAVEIQMNWIFILIAGVVILGFFVSIINKQKSLAEEQLSSSIKMNLGAILTGIRSSSGVASRITMPDVDIIFDCDGYIVGKANAIRSKTSFAPNLIKGPIITTWTYDWEMPFKVTNFLYVTSPYVRYVFVKDAGGVIEHIYKAFPNRTIIDQGETKAFFSKELIDESGIADLQDRNNYKVRLIFAGGTGSVNPTTVYLPNLGSVKSRDFTAVKIGAESPAQLDSMGELVFYRKGRTNLAPIGRTFYVGKASAFGAVFTEDPESFICNMERAFNSLAIVNQVYSGRADNLIAEFQAASPGSPFNACQTPYSVASDYFDAIDTNTGSYAPSNVTYVYGAAAGIEYQNEEALKKSCPAIY